jgi:hypothetical protein
MERVEKYSYDIDGTITAWEGGSKWVRRIPFFLLHLLVFIPPRLAVIREMRNHKAKGGQIALVSRRPTRARGITVWQMNRLSVPYDELYLVGAGHEEKLEVIKKIGVVKHYDNSKNFGRFCQIAGVLCEIV